MKILVFGKDGQLGLTFASQIPESGIISTKDQLILLNKNECELNKPKQIQNSLRKYQPDIIINCAAFTSVDLAENQVEIAYAVNAHALTTIAEEAKKINALVIHYSTDYVFDGDKKTAYVESDQPNPINIYGKSKLLGEKYLQSNWDKHLIFRTSWIFSKYPKNFLKTILLKATQSDSLDIVADQFGSPTSTNLIVDSTIKIIKLYLDNIKHPPISFDYGIYHLSSSGLTNWYEYAKFIIDNVNYEKLDTKIKSNQINPKTTIEYPSNAKRPQHSQLNNSLIQKTFSLDLPYWQQGVLEVLAEENLI